MSSDNTAGAATLSAEQRAALFLETQIKGAAIGFDTIALAGLKDIKGEKGRVVCSLLVEPKLQNRYGTLHGGCTGALGMLRASALRHKITAAAAAGMAAPMAAMQCCPRRCCCKGGLSKQLTGRRAGEAARQPPGENQPQLSCCSVILHCVEQQHSNSSQLNGCDGVNRRLVQSTG